MVRVVFFDVGALVDRDGRPHPDVADALATISRFKTSSGRPLATALVADADAHKPRSTRTEIAATFAPYLERLGRMGLAHLFEPADRRVTLSIRSGARLPDRAVFRTALKRLRSTATLGDCVLVTAHTNHARAVRKTLKMQAVCFASVPAAGVDFSDWRQAPALVARLVDGGAGANTLMAVRRFLHVAHAFDVESLEMRAHGHRVEVHGSYWAPVATPPEIAGPLYVPFPADGVVVRRPRGEIADVNIAGPSAVELSEATTFVRSVARHGQIGATRGETGRAATHTIETDDQGRRKLVRRALNR